MSDIHQPATNGQTTQIPATSPTATLPYIRRARNPAEMRACVDKVLLMLVTKKGLRPIVKLFVEKISFAEEAYLFTCSLRYQAYLKKSLFNLKHKELYSEMKKTIEIYKQNAIKEAQAKGIDWDGRVLVITDDYTDAVYINCK